MNNVCKALGTKRGLMPSRDSQSSQLLDLRRDEQDPCSGFACGRPLQEGAGRSAGHTRAGLRAGAAVNGTGWAGGGGLLGFPPARCGNILNLLWTGKESRLIGFVETTLVN